MSKTRTPTLKYRILYCYIAFLKTLEFVSFSFQKIKKTFGGIINSEIELNLTLLLIEKYMYSKHLNCVLPVCKQGDTAVCCKVSYRYNIPR